MNPVEKLFSYAPPIPPKYSMAVMQQLDAWLGSPHRAFSSIHIAGTNGKGSVSLKIASALQHAGLKVGLYTSPHISTYRERIQINGQLIPEKEALERIAPILSYVEQKNLQPTFFELLTAFAFRYFADEKVDIAVLETGMGGLFDATNIVTPILSVITSIEIDHSDILGETREAIAQAKAGIIKPHIPVVLGPRAKLSAIQRAIKAHGCACIEAPTALGFYDRENSAIARAALQSLSVPLAAIEEGIKKRPPCRFETVSGVILDGAHNPDGFRHLSLALEEHFPQSRCHFLLALSKNKDLAGCLSSILPKASRLICVSNGHPRLLSAPDLAKATGGEAKDLPAALIEARTQSNPVVCGSFFIMSDARRLLGIDEPRDNH